MGEKESTLSRDTAGFSSISSYKEGEFHLLLNHFKY